MAAVAGASEDVTSGSFSSKKDEDASSVVLSAAPNPEFAIELLYPLLQKTTQTHRKESLRDSVRGDRDNISDRCGRGGLMMLLRRARFASGFTHARMRLVLI